MQRIVGSVLNTYMSSFVKNYSSENFQNWELKNLEFKEDVIQNLLNVPPNLEVKQVKCSSLSVSIPWSSLRSKPIVFYLGRIDIILIEPTKLRYDNKPVTTQQEPGSRGFAAKLIEGVKLQINELHLTIQTLGPHKEINNDNDYSNKEVPPALQLDIENIVIESTNSSWEIVEDLTDTIQINNQSEIILYKVMRLGTVSVSLIKQKQKQKEKEKEEGNNHESSIAVLQDTPITSHV